MMTRLLYEGFAVHGDDLVLLRRGEVLPFPRRLGVRPPTVALIPQLASLLAPGRAATTRELAVDPSELGFAWFIEPAPVDAVFFLEPNRGGATWLEVCPKFVMAERVMALSTTPAGGAGQWVGDICAMLERALCHVLHFGDLAAAGSALKEALQGLRKP